MKARQKASTCAACGQPHGGVQVSAAAAGTCVASLFVDWRRRGADMACRAPSPAEVQKHGQTSQRTLFIGERAQVCRLLGCVVVGGRRRQAPHPPMARATVAVVVPSSPPASILFPLLGMLRLQMQNLRWHPFPPE